MEDKDKDSAEVGEFKFKTMAEMDKDRKPWTGGSVFGKCICGNQTDLIRFFGNQPTKCWCCSDGCFHSINVAYFNGNG